MFGSVLLAAAALMLASTASTAHACRCVPPPPLSDCNVRGDQAALLVTINCVKSLICDVNDGVAVADVIIDRVFQDNAGLGFEEGDKATISSFTQSSLCGLGKAFAPGDQWIVFARPPFKGGSGSGSAGGVFSDGSVCEVMDADLEIGGCSDNIRRPSAAQVEELAEGCGNPIVNAGPPPPPRINLNIP